MDQGLPRSPLRGGNAEGVKQINGAPMCAFVGGRFPLRAPRAGARRAIGNRVQPTSRKKGCSEAEPRRRPLCEAGAGGDPTPKVGSLFLEVGWNGAPQVKEIWDIFHCTLANAWNKQLARRGVESSRRMHTSGRGPIRLLSPKNRPAPPVTTAASCWSRHGVGRPTSAARTPTERRLPHAAAA